MSCSAACPTPGQHATYGECLRAKALHVGYCRSAAGLDRTREKQWDADNQAYADARRQGIRPASTNRAAVDAAVRESDRTGVAFHA